MNKNIKHLLFSLLLLAMPLQCIELAGDDYALALEVHNVENDTLDEQPTMDTIPLPDKAAIVVNGDISTLIVNQLYNPVPTTKIFSWLETPHIIKTTLTYVPVALLNDITEEASFNHMQDIIQNIVLQPTEDEYAAALRNLDHLNQVAMIKFLPVELHQEARNLWNQSLRLLVNQKNYSDVEFTEQCIALVVDSAEASLRHAAFYTKNTEIKTPSLDEYTAFIHTLTNLDALPCFVTSTAVVGLKKLFDTFNISETMITSYVQAGIFTVSPDIANMVIPAYFDDYKVFCKLFLSKLIRGLIAKNLGSNFVEYAEKRKSELDYLILQKLVEAAIPVDQPSTIVIDDNTVCVITPTVNVHTHEAILQVECTTTF